jgi:excinuclease ABC subunit A
VESLSAYARQFLGQMPKPHYETIRGLSPAISIEQKAASKNPRSTVGTVTEIYDYLRILFANIGRQHCLSCGRPVSKQSPNVIVRHIRSHFTGKIIIYAPIIQNRKGEFRDVFDSMKADGFSRMRVNGETVRIDREIPRLNKKQKHNLELVIDRIKLQSASRTRVLDSVETGLGYGREVIRVESLEDDKAQDYSQKFACVPCGISYRDLSPQSFSFNSPIGMCDACNGLGYRVEVDPELVVPNEDLSIHQGAIRVWSDSIREGEGWDGTIISSLMDHFGIDPDTPWKQLPKSQRDLILHGTGDKKIEVRFVSRVEKNEWNFRSSYPGVIQRLTKRYHDSHSERARQWYAQFMREMACAGCRGTRLKTAYRHVTIEGKSIIDVCRMTIGEAHDFFSKLLLSGNDKIIASEILKEIRQRFRFLLDVGLDYLTLDRKAPTLSGGESQRIRLASQIGSELSGVMYILDEPSIGLHQRDNARLLNSLRHLQNLGNSVIVIEHDEETIRSADHIVDFGPGAGIRGGEIVASGRPAHIRKSPRSLTGMYLSGKCSIPVPGKRRSNPGAFFTITGAAENNLDVPEVRFPVNRFICVTGVSGAGKSSLVNNILVPALSRSLNRSIVHVGRHSAIEGLEHFDKIINIDQKPIGRSSRSNPATYTKVYDPIRQFFTRLPESRLQGYKPGRFSFNVKGGRCEACQGAGTILVEMHFLPDVYVECEVCNGKRFNDNTLEVRFKGKSIADILEMTVLECFEIFRSVPRIRTILKTLIDVGMDYVPLGQPSSTLSGGEAQRIKLSRELCKKQTGKTLYVLDEPTTGLHFDDIRKLLDVLNRLVDSGNTVIVIEHNLDVVKTADHVIDLGPEGGEKGGRIVAQGTPEELARHRHSYTGRFLKDVLSR